MQEVKDKTGGARETMPPLLPLATRPGNPSMAAILRDVPGTTSSRASELQDSARAGTGSCGQRTADGVRCVEGSCLQREAT